MRKDITDFSMKDSSEYNNSVALYEDALNAVDSDLLNFEEASTYRDSIPTKLRVKTHNSADFLDEDKVSRRKMNADTSAIKELSEKYANMPMRETLMFGSDQSDLDVELIQDGLGLDILKVFKKHNITGKAIWEAVKSLKNYIGADPDILESIETLKEKANVTEDETDEDVDDTSDEDLDTEDDVASESDDSEEDEGLEESDDEESEVLSEKVRNLQRRIAEKNLRDLL